jgi:hypothetical protein
MKTQVLTTKVECYDEEMEDGIFVMEAVDEYCVEIKLTNTCYSEDSFKKLIEDLQAAFDKIDVYKEVKNVQSV